LFEQVQQVLPVAIFFERRGQLLQLDGIDESPVESDFLRAGNLEALPSLDSFDKISGLR